MLLSDLRQRAGDLARYWGMKSPGAAVCRGFGCDLKGEQQRRRVVIEYYRSCLGYRSLSHLRAFPYYVRSHLDWVGCAARACLAVDTFDVESTYSLNRGSGLPGLGAPLSILVWC